MEVQGRIKEIFETKEYGNNGFRKRLLVLTTEEQYPQPLAIDFVQDKTTLLDSFHKGQRVKIGINLRGREWTNPQGETKYFVNINGWRIENLEVQEQAGGSTPPPEDFEPMAPDFSTDGDEEDDLPF